MNHESLQFIHEGAGYLNQRAKAKTSLQHNVAKPIALRSHLKNHDDWPAWKFSVTGNKVYIGNIP